MEKLKEYRLKFNYTYQSMADLLFISKPYYWQLENGRRRITYEMAFNIANIFNVRPDEIFYDEFKNMKIKNS